MRERGFGQWETLAIGPTPNVDQLVHRLRRMPDLGYNVVSKLVTPQPQDGNQLLHLERATVEHVLDAGTDRNDHLFHRTAERLF